MAHSLSWFSLYITSFCPSHFTNSETQKMHHFHQFHLSYLLLTQLTIGLPVCRMCLLYLLTLKWMQLVQHLISHLFSSLSTWLQCAPRGRRPWNHARDLAGNLQCLFNASQRKHVSLFVCFTLHPQMALYSIVDMNERDQMLTTNCRIILILILPHHWH